MAQELDFILINSSRYATTCECQTRTFCMWILVSRLLCAPMFAHFIDFQTRLQFSGNTAQYIYIFVMTVMCMSHDMCSHKNCLIWIYVPTCSKYILLYSTEMVVCKNVNIGTLFNIRICAIWILWVIKLNESTIFVKCNPNNQYQQNM